MNVWLKVINKDLWIKLDTIDSISIDPIKEQDDRQVQLFTVGTWMTKFANVIFFVGTHEECLGYISEMMAWGKA
jgi:hypothetical protein